MDTQTTPPPTQTPNPTPAPPLTPAPPPAPAPPSSTLTPTPQGPKKSKKKVVLIVVAVIVALIGLLALVPSPPEETKPETSKIVRAQPAATKLERFADQKVDIAIPDGWTKSDDVELQNEESNSETEAELAKTEVYALYFDEAYTDSSESPTITMSVSDHGYVDNKAALKKVDELEKSIGNRNGHNVTVQKEKVMVGKFSQHEAYLYTYVDTFDTSTTEKLKRYELYVAAHDNYYIVHAHVPLPGLEKYDELVKRSVLSINPDE